MTLTDRASKAWVAYSILHNGLEREEKRAAAGEADAQAKVIELTQLKEKTFQAFLSLESAAEAEIETQLKLERAAERDQTTSPDKDKKRQALTAALAKAEAELALVKSEFIPEEPNYDAIESAEFYVDIYKRRIADLDKSAQELEADKQLMRAAEISFEATNNPENGNG